jgi:UDP-GlcNAc:undecaprenyl-phosphate/decaprenyl-phosphate GlcNAc-1-phosphate transferase
MIYIFLILFLLACMLLYLKLARKYNILDIPNHRSSHAQTTVRGGGIIFPISLLTAYFLSNFQNSYLLIAIFLLGLISFIDDIYTVSNKWRFVVQIISSALILYELDLGISLWIYPLLLFITIGGINTYNFMDGINGMTALYSIVVLGTLLWINQTVVFVDDLFISLPLLSAVLFSFFNVRKKAVCFAGDVGSVSMALIVLFLLFQLVAVTQNLAYCLLLLVYVLDAAGTIVRRIANGENIFEPHRTHLYQRLAHDLKWSHLKTSFTYAVIQLLLNLLVVWVVIGSKFSILLTSIIVSVLSISYIFAYHMTCRVK